MFGYVGVNRKLETGFEPVPPSLYPGVLPLHHVPKLCYIDSAFASSAGTITD